MTVADIASVILERLVSKVTYCETTADALQVRQVVGCQLGAYASEVFDVDAVGQPIHQRLSDALMGELGNHHDRRSGRLSASHRRVSTCKG